MGENPEQQSRDILLSLRADSAANQQLATATQQMVSTLSVDTASTQQMVTSLSGSMQDMMTALGVIRTESADRVQELPA